MYSKCNVDFLKNIFECEFSKLRISKKIINYNENEISINQFNKTISEDNYKVINNYIKTNNISLKAFFGCIYGFIISKYSNQDIIYTSFINENDININNNLNNLQPVLINFENKNSLKIIINEINKYLLQYEKQNISYSEISNFFNLPTPDNGIIILNNKLNNLNNNDNNNNELYSFLFNCYNLDIIFQVIDNNDKNNYSFSIYYNCNKYDDYLIENILNSYLEVIKNIDNIHENINTIKYIPLEEENKIIYDFNYLKYERDESKLCHVELSKIAKLYPDRVTLIYRDNKYTYGQLENMSNSLAYTLRKKGIQRNDIVPLICERSPYYLISIIAIIKAGGAFAFIDPEFSKERIQSMINDIKPKIILKFVENNNDIYLNENNEPISIYYLDQHHYDQNTSELPNVNDSDDIFCINFTSGSTGKPKGVMVSHNNMIHFCFHSQTCNGVDEIFKIDYNVIISLTRFTFSICIRELFGSLFRLKTIILCDNNEYNDPVSLGNIIMKYHVEYLSCTHSRVNTYLNNEIFQKSLKEIKILALGGENIKPDFLKRLIKYTNAAIYNMYGITENNGLTLISRVDISSAINSRVLPIGYPNCNCDIYVLDKNLNPVPVGVEGELYVAGDGVTKGYLNQENLTHSRFIKCPFQRFKNKDNNSSNRIMYKSGDLCQWTNDGRIICNGRNDFQIKIRGQRVELGEIENTIKEIEGITYALVIGKTNKSHNNNNNNNNNNDNNDDNDDGSYLICYYIYNNMENNNNNNDNKNKQNNENISEKEIRDYLIKKLPVHMIPSYFIRIDNIPINANGKLNRKALPEPNLKQIIANNYCSPETDIEEKLCKIYKEVFHIKDFELGRMNDFYQLGGNSFNAIEILSIIEKELKIKLSIKNIYTYPVIKDLGKYIEKILNNKEENIIKSHRADIIEKTNIKEFPITSQQLGVYIDSIKNPNSLIYNNPSSFKLNKSIDIEKIKEAFLKLFEEHEILKCKFYEKEINGKIGIYGCIDNDCKLTFENYTLENVYQFIKPFNLNKAPLIRVGFIEDKNILLLDIHHIIIDGNTFTLIKKELNNYYYNGIINKLKIQYSDYAIHLNNNLNSGYYEKQISFYEEMFKEEYDLLNIPTKEYNTFKIETINEKKEEKEKDNNKEERNEKDEENRNENRNEKNNVGIYNIIINKSLSSLINKYIQHQEISKSAFFMSIYGYILSKYSNQEIIYSSIVTTNRNNYYTKNMIGMFASTQPILLKYNHQEKPFKIKEC